MRRVFLFFGEQDNFAHFHGCCVSGRQLASSPRTEVWEASNFFRHLVSHAVSCRGGTLQQIPQRRAGAYADIRTDMGSRVAPVSSFLQNPLQAGEEQ